MDKYSLRPHLYFTVKDWMFSKLQLNGTRLLVFAFLFDVSLNQDKVDSKTVSDVIHVKHRDARYQLLKLFQEGLVQREKKSQQIGFKYVYFINTDKVYSKVFDYAEKKNAIR